MIDTIKELGGLIITISSVLGIFTGIVNKVFTKKLKPINEKIDNNEKELLRQSMDQWRFQVVNFAGEIRRGIGHTKYQYESIFKMIDNYEMAIEKLGLSNHLFDEEVIFIEQSYRDINKNNE